jgi:hypothetical protein
MDELANLPQKAGIKKPLNRTPDNRGFRPAFPVS